MTLQDISTLGSSMEKSPLKRSAKKISEWYHGKFIPYKDDPSSPVRIMGGYVKRHWTSSAFHTLIGFLSSNWKFLITSLIALASIVLALLKLT